MAISFSYRLDGSPCWARTSEHLSLKPPEALGCKFSLRFSVPQSKHCESLCRPVRALLKQQKNPSATRNAFAWVFGSPCCGSGSSALALNFLKFALQTCTFTSFVREPRKKPPSWVAFSWLPLLGSNQRHRD